MLAMSSIDEAFEAALAVIGGNGALAEAQRHLVLAPAAKRVRPKFVIACGKLLDVSADKLLESASAVELFHAASLLHDDIVDDAESRRERPSANALYGNHMAVLAGDQLLSNALRLLASQPQASLIVAEAAKTLQAMTEAVALEAKLRGQAQTSTEEVIQIVDGKTGVLFGLSGYLAGIAAGDVAAAERLSLAGRLAGRAFQIRDDIDDLDEDAAGGVPTLPQIVGIEESEQAVTDALAQACEALEPYSEHPAYRPLIENIYQLARTPLPARSSEDSWFTLKT